MNGDQQSIEGTRDGFVESDAERLNEASPWQGLPAFHPESPREIRLVLTCETEAARDEVIAKLGLVIAKKTKGTWSAWYPPREREDLAALRFEFDPDTGDLVDEPEDDRSASQIVRDEVDALDAAEMWSDHLGHQISIETGHDGALVGARCVTCDEDLPEPDAVRNTTIDGEDIPL